MELQDEIGDELSKKKIDNDNKENDEKNDKSIINPIIKLPMIT